MRYTVRNLREDIARYNRNLAASGSTYFLVNHDRNGYRAVDLYAAHPASGEAVCVRNIGAGTARECRDTIRLELPSITGRHWLDWTARRLKVSRAAAFAVLSVTVDFSADFHSLPSDNVEAIAAFAKVTGYRKPANANGSTGRYFFAHLQKLARRHGWRPVNL